MPRHLSHSLQRPELPKPVLVLRYLVVVIVIASNLGRRVFPRILVKELSLADFQGWRVER